MTCKSSLKFVSHHYKQNDKLRMGQRFVNYYIKNSWPELFYATDIQAMLMIGQWLIDHQYTEELPKKIKRK